MSEKREFPILNGKLMSDLDLNGHKLLGLPLPEGGGGGGSSVEVVAPSPAGAGKAADAKATHEALEAKRDKTDLAVYSSTWELPSECLPVSVGESDPSHNVEIKPTPFEADEGLRIGIYVDGDYCGDFDSTSGVFIYGRDLKFNGRLGEPSTWPILKTSVVPGSAKILTSTDVALLDDVPETGQVADARAVYEALEGFATEADLLAFYYPDGSVTSMDQITTSGIEYAVGEDGGAYVVKGEGLIGDVILPWEVTIDGTEYKVTAIGRNAFDVGSYANSFTSFTAPTTVKNIGNAAFTGHYSLTTVNLSSVTSIGDRTFGMCTSLTTVNLPSATSIGDAAFGDCAQLTTVNLPSATSIGDAAFIGCLSLSMIDFGTPPKTSIPTLGNSAFSNIPTTCKFIIPLGMYDEWITAPGWSDLYAAGYKFDGYASAEQVKATIPKFLFVDAAIADGVVTVAPYTNAKLAIDGTAFTVAVGGESGKTRDCVLRVECGETAPKITWPSNFHPRTDAETDFACVAGVRNVYWITEHSPNEFCVAGWQETSGGGTSGGGSAS